MGPLGGDQKSVAADAVRTDFFGPKQDAGSRRSLRELLAPRPTAPRSRASGTKLPTVQGPFRLKNALPGRAIALRTALQVSHEGRGASALARHLGMCAHAAPARAFRARPVRAQGGGAAIGGLGIPRLARAHCCSAPVALNPRCRRSPAPCACPQAVYKSRRDGTVMEAVIFLIMLGLFA